MMKKNIPIAALLLILLLTPILGLAAIPTAPMGSYYVNDFADVMRPEDEREMLALGRALEEASDAQVVAVTVSFLDGMDIEEYAYQLFNAWGIGVEGKDNGVLLLLSIGDREIWAMVGEGLEDAMPASVLTSYIDKYAIPHLSNDDFSTGMRENYKALCEKVAAINGVSLSKTTDSQGDTAYAYTATLDGGISFMEIIVGIIVISVILSIVKSAFRSTGNATGCLFGWLLGRSTRPRRWFGPGTFGGGHHHHHHRPSAPRPHPRPTSRGTGGFGGGGRPGGFGGGRSGGFGGGRGGSTRGGGGGRKF